MGTLYQEMIPRFLSPISRLGMGVTDALYFLRQDDALVFTEGYLHPPGGLMGKVMLYPDSSGDVEIFGRRFRSSYKRIRDGRLELIPHREQMKMQFELTPSLDRNAPRPVFEEFHVEFPLTNFRGVFEHRHSLEVAMDLYPTVRRTINELSENFVLPLRRLGCTGSTCYGKFEEPDDDIDLVFYGSVAENGKILQKIKSLTLNPRNRVVEFGRLWPIRFYWKKTMICSFFNYRLEREIPLRNCRMELLQSGVVGRGVVSDDTHSIYMPPVLTLSQLVLDGKKSGDLALVIYDGSLRGEYYNGDRLEFKGKRVRVEMGKKQFEALLVTLGSHLRKSVV